MHRLYDIRSLVLTGGGGGGGVGGEQLASEVCTMCQQQWHRARSESHTWATKGTPGEWEKVISKIDQVFNDTAVGVYYFAALPSSLEQI